MAHDPDVRIRHALAYHAALPEDVRDRLAQDTEIIVRQAVMWAAQRRPQHLAQPPQPLVSETPSVEEWLTQLRRLAPTAVMQAYPSAWARASLSYCLALSYPIIPPEDLTLAAESLIWLERYIVARHPQIPDEVRAALTRDGIVCVRNAAQSLDAC